MTESEWLSLKAGLLYESGMTLAEVGERMGGISRQAVEQRLRRVGVARRARGNRTRSSYPKWQRNLLQRARDLGLSLAEACKLLSLPMDDLETRCDCGLSPGSQANEFRIASVGTAWEECRRDLLAAALVDGASHLDVSRLAGVGLGSVKQIVTNLRSYGYLIPDGRRSRWGKSQKTAEARRGAPG